MIAWNKLSQLINYLIYESEFITWDVLQFSMKENTSNKDRGIIPMDSSPNDLYSPPSIVYVFPVPVYPYANTVELNPFAKEEYQSIIIDL